MPAHCREAQQSQADEAARARLGHRDQEHLAAAAFEELELQQVERRLGGDDAQVLVVQVDAEARIEVPSEHPRGLALEDGVAGQPAGQQRRQAKLLDQHHLVPHRVIGQYCRRLSLPDYFQIDVRAGWRGRMGQSRALEVFLDIFNITNRTNFDSPTTASSDRRTPNTFLVLTNLRGGGETRKYV